MRPIGVAAIKAGLVSDDTLKEMKRWGLLPVGANDDLTPYASADAAIEGIREALESEEQVRIQTTDLDALHWYLNIENQRKGRLVLADTETGEKGSKTIVFSIFTPANKVLIPWVSESITELMLNGDSYLSYKDDDGTNKRIRFKDVEELYFGATKAFMACVPEEADDE